MSRTIPKRYVWAVDILDVQPNDVILEVGCGYGHAIPPICEMMVDGELIAIDRSEKMAAAAQKTNAAYLGSGRVSIVHQDLLASTLPAHHFDKIFLFNLNVFWMDPRRELAEVRGLLKPNGRFYIFHQPPPGHDLDEFATAFRDNLLAQGFTIVGCKKNEDSAVRSVCLISTNSKPSAVL